MFGDSNEAGLGVVIRNNKGEVMAAFAEKIPLPYSRVSLETLAARRAIPFVADLGFSQSIFKGDSEILVKALDNENHSLASIGHIIKDIQFTLSFFQTHSFSQTRRQGNFVPHALVGRARNSFPLEV